MGANINKLNWMAVHGALSMISKLVYFKLPLIHVIEKVVVISEQNVKNLFKNAESLSRILKNIDNSRI